MARATKEEWAQRVEGWKRSGQRADEYAAAIGVKSKTLQNWGWRFGARGASSVVAAHQKKTVRFIELVSNAPRGEGASASMLEVVLPNGACVRVPSSFDDDVVRRVLRLAGGH